MSKTVKIKPSHKSQGEFVIISVEQFNPSEHELIEGESLPTEDIQVTNDALIPVEQFDVVTEKLAHTEEELAVVKGEFIAFKNDIEAMKARIEELESGNGIHDPLDGPKEGDYLSWSNEQLKAHLTDLGIKHKASASKEDLISLIPKE